MLNLILQNIVLGISLAAPVGPVTISVVKSGLKHGFFSALLVGLGAALTDTTYLLLIFFGMSNLFSIPIVEICIWIFGMLFLFYLGSINLKEFFKPNSSVKKIVVSKNAFLTGYVITISNPITIIWWISVFGTILNFSFTNSFDVILLFTSLTIILGVILWFSTLSALIYLGKKYVNDIILRYASLITGVVFIGFGLYFAYNLNLYFS